MAGHYNVTPDAIAGTILWEALENPYERGAFGRGQGLLLGTRPGGWNDFGIAAKIHTNPGSEAEAVEDAVRQRRPDAFTPPEPKYYGKYGNPIYPSVQEQRQERLLEDPTVAIETIGAILDRAATLYEERARVHIPGFSIRDQAGVLGALFQGGIDGRLEFIENKLKKDGSEYRPQLPEGEKMGPWISQYRWWIRDYLKQCGCEFPSKFDPVPLHPNYDTWL